MRVEIEKLGRGSFTKAKTEFSKTWPDCKIQYWEDFGKANNLKVIIDDVKHGFPVINALEFNDEQSYIWFMMKWA